METKSIIPNSTWIEKDDHRNKFGLRFLDCRSVTETLTSTSQSMEIAQSYVRLRSSNGLEHSSNEIGEYRKIEVNLVYPLINYEEGILYKSPAMEYKWDIYLYNDTLYFTRSWTGHLSYLVPIKLIEGKLLITELYVPNEIELKEEYLKNAVDFLIKSHLYRITVPHPIQPDLVNEKDEIIALSAFSLWGRYGAFASFEDTSKLDLTHLSERFEYPIRTQFNSIKNEHLH